MTRQTGHSPKEQPAIETAESRGCLIYVIVVAAYLILRFFLLMPNWWFRLMLLALAVGSGVLYWQQHHWGWLAASILLSLLFLFALLVTVQEEDQAATGQEEGTPASGEVPYFPPIKGYHPLRAVANEPVTFLTDHGTRLVASSSILALAVCYEQNIADDCEAIVHLRLTDQAGAVWEGEAYLAFSNIVLQIDSQPEKRRKAIPALAFDDISPAWRQAFQEHCLFDGVYEQLGDQGIFRFTVNDTTYRVDSSEQVPRYALAVLDDPNEESSTMLMLLDELTGEVDGEEEDVPPLVFPAPCLPFILRNYNGRHESLPEEQWFSNPPIVMMQTGEVSDPQPNVREVDGTS